MTLEEKIQRFLAEAREQGIKSWHAAPPINRLLWSLRLDVPPLFHWSFRAHAVFHGCYFAIFMFCWFVFVQNEQWDGAAVGAFFGGLVFGLGMAWFFQRRNRRWRFSPWGR